MFYKKIIFGLIISCTALVHPTHLIYANEDIQQTTCTKYDLLKGAAHFYGTCLAGSAIHEFGHWAVGKRIHRCNGVFWITPTGSGTTCHYYNPTKDVLKSLWNNDMHYPIKHAPIHRSVLAAGPLFGIGFSLLAPIANTFYHEYKQENSVLNALTRTTQQSYLNDRQNLGLVLGAQCSLLGNLLNLSPFSVGSDGNKIAKTFNFACSPSKLGKIATAITAATLVSPLYMKTAQRVFPE